MAGPVKSQLRRARGTTLVELLVAIGIGAVVLTVVAMLFMTGMRSFAGLGNYAALSGQSRLSMDLMSRDMREASGIIAAQTNGTEVILQLTNSLRGLTITYVWDSSTGVLTSSKTDSGGNTTIRTNLTGCDQWYFTFYQRTPQSNWTYYTANNQSMCKLINMSWKCSRKILGRKIDTEDVTTAEIVLRNKP